MSFSTSQIAPKPSSRGQGSIKAMIFAAGLGTRFKPWTDSHPKALAMVNGKCLLQRNIEYLQDNGISEVIINVHHFADQIREAVKDSRGWGSQVTISDETQEVLETGGGLKNASWYFDNGPFVLINADILTDMDLGAMITHHRTHRPLATLAVTQRQTSRYFLFDDHMLLHGWRNLKTGEEKISAAGSSEDLQQKAFSGIHVIDPGIFDLIRLEGKFSMVDLYLDLARFQSIRGYDHTGSLLVDVGSTQSLGEAEKLFI